MRSLKFFLGWFPFFLGVLPSFGWAQAATPAAEVVKLTTGEEIRGIVLGQSANRRLWMVAQRQWLQRVQPGLLEKCDKEGIEREGQIRLDLSRRILNWRDGLTADQEGIRTFLEDELKSWEAKVEPTKGQLVLIGLKPTQIKKWEPRMAPIRQLVMLAMQERVQGLEERTALELIKDLKGLGLEPGRDRANILDRIPPFPIEDDSDWLARKALLTFQMGRVLQLQGSGDLLVEQPKPGAANGVEGLLVQMIPKFLNKALGDILGAPSAPKAWQPVAIQMGEAAKVDMIRVIRVEPDLANRRMMVEDTILGKTGPGRWVVVWQTQLLADGNRARPSAEAIIKSDPQIAPLLKAAAALGADAQINEAIRFGAATMELQAEANQKFGQFLKLSTKRLDGVPLKWLQEP